MGSGSWGVGDATVRGCATWNINPLEGCMVCSFTIMTLNQKLKLSVTEPSILF